ncbi:cell division/cell wall cluster transcriptional repressor MraZ [Candidatus Woesebacteria bacterium]|nr:cell division/cell wall cluster transcriptional repressor MraZ [Candidatus Woesebacteria bacterium]
MLIGQYHTKISSKGRTALPSRFRRYLGRKVVISRWYEGSLAVFSNTAWERVLDKALGEALLTGPTRDTERFLLGGAYEIELDAQGRFVAPGPLRKYAGLEDEVVFIGLRSRVEVWSRNRWKEKEIEVTKNAEKLIEHVQKVKS